MFMLAHPRKGDACLIHSAAGGVGTALVQLARIAGCSAVVGVVGSASKVAAARAAGCTHVIDKGSADLWAEARAISPAGYDMVFGERACFADRAMC